MTTDPIIAGGIHSADKNVPAVGIYHNVPFQDYCRWDAINWHSLAPFRKSQRHGRYETTIGGFSTKAENRGDTMHAIMFEPKRLESEYAVMPEFEGHPNSKIHRDQKSQWIIDHQMQAHVSARELAEIQAQIEAVKNHPIAGPIMAGKGANEIGIVWKDADGNLCKGRVDTMRRVPAGLINLAAVKPDAEVIVMPDLKGTACTAKSPNRNLVDVFDAESDRLGYHGQIAFYHDGMAALRPGVEIVPLIIAVETVPPFDVCVFDMRPMLEAGRILYRAMMKRRAEGLKTSRWAGAANQLVPMFPKPWQPTEEEI